MGKKLREAMEDLLSHLEDGIREEALAFVEGNLRDKADEAVAEARQEVDWELLAREALEEAAGDKAAELEVKMFARVKAYANELFAAKVEEIRRVLAEGLENFIKEHEKDRQRITEDLNKYLDALTNRPWWKLW